MLIKGTIDEKLNLLKEFMGNSYRKKVIVDLENGEKLILNLFISNLNRICYVIPRKRKMGYPVTSRSDFSNWVSIEDYETSISIDKRARLFYKHCVDASKMLKKSGLWSNIKNEIDYAISGGLSLAMEIVKDSEDFYENIYMQRKAGCKYSWMDSYQIFESLLKNNCWKTINFEKCDRITYTAYIKERLNKKEDYNTRWRKNYDNSIEIKMGQDDIYRGFYSEEYKNCGNGHYYLLFDEKHAIFYEND